MTSITSPPEAATEHEAGAEVGIGTDTDIGTDIDIDADTTAVRRVAAGSRRSVGTGVRNGLVRTRTVRSNSVRALLRMKDDRGAATAEYIVATMAAVGFAGLLIVILRGDEVRGILTELVRSALTVG